MDVTPMQMTLSLVSISESSKPYWSSFLYSGEVLAEDTTITLSSIS